MPTSEQQLGIRIPDDLMDRLEVHLARTGESKRSFIMEAIQSRLTQQEIELTLKGERSL